MKAACYDPSLFGYLLVFVDTTKAGKEEVWRKSIKVRSLCKNEVGGWLVGLNKDRIFI